MTSSDNANLKITKIQMSLDQYAKMIRIMSNVILSPEDNNKISTFMQHKLEIDTMAGSFHLLGTPNNEKMKKLKDTFLSIYVKVYGSLKLKGIDVRPGPIDRKYENPSSMDRYQ